MMTTLGWKGATTRRAAAIGAALALLLVVAIALSGGGDEDPETQPAAPEPAGPLARAPSIGASVRRPAGWRSRRGRRSLALRSPDRSTLISISLPPRARRSAAVLKDAAAAVRRGYGEARFQSGRGRRLAGLPTISAVASGENRSGVRVQILVAAVQGNRRAWLVQVFSAPGRDAGRRLVQAQVALGTLRLRG